MDVSLPKKLEVGGYICVTVNVSVWLLQPALTAHQIAPLCNVIMLRVVSPVLHRYVSNSTLVLSCVGKLWHTKFVVGK